MTKNALTRSEKNDLTRLEEVISRGLQTFYDVGCALTEIRDRRLYRTEYGTFESYCSHRWQIGRKYAYRLIQAAGVVKNLSPMGDIVPLNERQARPLAQLAPDLQRLVWSQVLAETDEDAKVIAARVEELVRLALAALPPERRLAIFQEEEEEEIAAAKKLTRQQKIEKLQRALVRLEKVLAELGYADAAQTVAAIAEALAGEEVCQPGKN